MYIRNLKIRALFFMLLSMFAVDLFAHEIEVANSDGITIYYNFINNKTELEVCFRGRTYYTYTNEYTGKVVIPESVIYEGTTYPVTKIRGYAFSDCSGLEDVTIPKSVTNIARYAFRNCNNLINVTFHCKEIKSWSLDNKSIRNVTIGDEVETIGGSAFNNCNNLTDVIIGNSVTSIGSSAFFNCTGLTNINIGNSVTDIGASAFSGCSNLTNVVVGNSVTNIGINAFRNCTSLTEVEFHCKEIKSWFVDQPSIKNIIIGNEVNAIGIRAFDGCSGLSSVTIPNSVTSIGSSAFYGCTGLANITIPNSVTNIGDYAFQGCTGLTNITIPNSVTNIGYSAFFDCSGLTSITIPNSVTNIESATFKGCIGLTSVTIPNSVTNISSSAFSGCTGLTNITIPNSVTNIGGEAFKGCTGFTSIIIPSSMIYIDSGAFLDCNNLTNVTFHCNEIGSWFSYKSYIKNVIIGDEVKIIGKNAFNRCTNLTDITIGNSVDSIAGDAFAGCIRLTTVDFHCKIIKSWFCRNTTIKDITIGDEVEIIHSQAFSGCSKLEKVLIGSSVFSIGNAAFNYCKDLSFIQLSENNSIFDSRDECNAIIETASNTLLYGCKNSIIPNSVTKIGDSAFEGCSNMESITIPKSVTNVGKIAFWGCDGLKTVTIHCKEVDRWFSNTNIQNVIIGSEVERIGLDAFSGCDGLKTVTIHCKEVDRWFSNTNIQNVIIGDEVESIGDYAFENCRDLTNLTIGNSVRFIYELAFGSCDKLSKISYFSNKPFPFYHDIFPESCLNEATLYVPGSSIEIYRNTAGWRDFVNILPIDYSTISLHIKDDNGTDLTGRVSITWYNEEKERIGTGSTLGGIKKDAIVFYSVELDEELGREFREVNMQKVVANFEEVTYNLEKIPTVTLTGQIFATGIEAALAEVTVTQRLNGKYEQVIRTKTDADGRFLVEVMDDVTEMTVQYADYSDYRLTRERLGTGNLGALYLERVEGTLLAINLSYQEAAVLGEQPNIQNWYTDTHNIQYNLYNKTKGMLLTDFAMQQGDIVLPMGVDIGDCIGVTAHSLKGGFADATAEVIIGNDATAEVNLLLKAYGGVDVSYSQKHDEQLLAMLYDSDGHLAAHSTFNGYNTSVSHLQAGTYRLVTMGYSGSVGSVESLSDLSSLGLTEGVDYVLSMVTVSDGIISTLYVADVPELDISKFEYTSANTSYLPNCNQMTVGMLATMTVQVAFQPKYAEHISNVQLIVNIPEGCEFVDYSVCIDNALKSYTKDVSRLTIPLTVDEIDSRVRFCLRPTIDGTFRSTALVEFDYQGDHTQAVGDAVFEATGMNIYAPSTTCEKAIVVSGIAASKAEVAIYDGGHLIGTTTAKMDGTWRTECELYNAYNLSTHEIYAQYRQQQTRVKTASVDCLYDMNSLVAKSVTMNYNGKDIVFDYVTNTCSTNYYSFVPSIPTFTFIADLTANNNTSVSSVTFYVHTTQDNVRKLIGFFDEKQSRWVAVSKFNSFCLPINVSVEVEANVNEKEVLADSKQMKNALSVINIMQEDVKESEAAVIQILSEMDAADKSEDDAQMALLFLKMSTLLGIEGNSYKDVPMADSEWDDFINQTDLVIKSNSGVLDGLEEADLGNLSPDVLTRMNGITISNAEGLNVRELVTEGYVTIQKTDGTEFYIKYDELSYTLVDITNNIVIRISNNAALTRGLNMPKWMHWPPTVEDILNGCNTLKGVIDNICSVAEPALERIEAIIAENCERILSMQIEYMALRKAESNMGNIVRRAMITARLKTLVPATDKLKNVAKWLERLKVGRFCNIAGSLYDLVKDGYDAVKSITEMNNNLLSVPVCKNVEAEANLLRHDIERFRNGSLCYYGSSIAADIISLDLAVAAIVAAPETGGSSCIGLGASIAIVAAKIVANAIYDKKSKSFNTSIKNEINRLEEKCGREEEPEEPEAPEEPENPEPENNKKQEETIPKDLAPVPQMENNLKPAIDPSGFVYEAVPTNRIKGVTATIYEQETGTTPWDAEEYSQANPQVTDETGLYQWDVPIGNWQVRFVKEGYETMQTEWLPVPPPQLEINIPMTQGVAPEAVKAHGTESGITLTFSKYMRPNTVEPTERLLVVLDTPSPLRTEQNAAHQGDAIMGRTDMVNLEEDPYTGNSYASIVKFVPTDKPLKVGDVVLLTVKKDVESYCGMKMSDDQTLRVVIEPEIEAIKCEPLVAVDYMGTEELEITLLPAEAAKGRKMTVESTSPMIASVDVSEIVFDEEGKARIVISGELPGEASIRLSMTDIDMEAQTTVCVVLPEKKVKTPKASKPTGSEVDYGYQLSLTSNTTGATIFYTIDGSDPKDEQKRIKYTEPIVIQNDVTVKAIAVRKNMDDSDVATFVYTLIPKSPGDANNDGKVNEQDIETIVRYIMNGDDKGLYFRNADVNDDKIVNAADIVLIVDMFK